MNQKKTIIKITSAVLTVVILCAMIPFLTGEKKKTLPEAKERVIKLFRIHAGTGSSNISYPGKIQPVRHASLFFRVSGPVIEQNLKLGQSIKAGEVLMRIDPRDYERDVERLSHELEMRKIENKLLDIEYKRMKKLLDSKAVSQANYDSALTKKESSDAQIKMLETSRKIANDKLSDTVLRAPFDASITEIKIENYEMAQAFVPVVTIQSLQNLEIRVNIPEGNIPNISLQDGAKYKNQKFKVTFPGRGDREFFAVFTEFKLSAATESGTYELRLRMEQPEDFIILPGMTAEVHGLPHMIRNLLRGVRVPYAAVILQNKKPGVWVYHPDSKKLLFRTVKVGKAVDGNFLSIGEGLNHGEYVVAAGGDWLTENTPVKILNPEVFHETD